MTLGIALVLIFILYLIDKNQVWRQAVKVVMRVVIALAVLGVLGIAGFFGWAKYGEWRTARREADAQKQRQQVADADCATVNPGWVAVDVTADSPHGISCRDPKKRFSPIPSPVIAIHGGETLQIVPVPPTPGGLESGFIPIVYLGHDQKFVMACGNYGETQVPTTFPKIERGNTVCP